MQVVDPFLHEGLERRPRCKEAQWCPDQRATSRESVVNRLSIDSILFLEPLGVVVATYTSGGRLERAKLDPENVVLPRQCPKMEIQSESAIASKTHRRPE